MNEIYIKELKEYSREYILGLMKKDSFNKLIENDYTKKTDSNHFKFNFVGNHIAWLWRNNFEEVYTIKRCSFSNLCANLFCARDIVPEAEKLRACRDLINQKTGKAGKSK